MKRKHRKAKIANGGEHTQKGLLGANVTTATKTATKIIRWRQGLGVALIVPVILLCLLELALYVGGYGYPTSFLLKNSDDTLSTNRHFGRLFFPEALVRTPVNLRLASPKPANEVRIVVVGSSAAMGDPDPSFGFGRILERMLNHAYTGTTFRVVNAAMTAINSHAINVIARDCMAVEPDLFIIYTGNNEVVGPYGPATVFRRVPATLWLIRASIWIKRTRVGQLLDSLAGQFRDEPRSAADWKGIDMFTTHPVDADADSLQPVYRNLEANLSAILDSMRAQRVPVLLCTVPTNIRDCPPFLSQHGRVLTTNELEAWGDAYGKAATHASAGKHDEALACFEAVMEIDPAFAELHFRMAQVLGELGRGDEAESHLIQARDLDCLRVRADSRINSIIARVATSQPHAVQFCDAASIIARHDTNHTKGVSGSLFYDHVHLTFAGNYHLARALLGEVAHLIEKEPLTIDSRVILSEEACKLSLAYTAWDDYRILAGVADTLTQAPFDAQYDYRNRVTVLSGRLRMLEKTLTPTNFAIIRDEYRAATDLSPEDWMIRRNLALLDEAMGNLDREIEEWLYVLDHFPEDALAHERCGMAMISKRRFADGLEHLHHAILLRPHNPYAYANMAAGLLAAGQPKAAIDMLRKAVSMNPDDGLLHTKLATACLEAGFYSEATNSYLVALARMPSNALLHNNFGTLLSLSGDVAGAEREWRETLRLDPTFHAARLNLANLLLKSGMNEEAVLHLQRVITEQPTAVALNNLGIGLKRLGRDEEAVKQFEAAIAMDPVYIKAHMNLAEFWEYKGDLMRARKHVEDVIAIDPNHAAANAAQNRLTFSVSPR